MIERRPDAERPADPDGEPPDVPEAFLDDERPTGYPDQDPEELPPLQDPADPSAGEQA